jgi:thiol-disulfide isomerase/thioredoxin
MERNTLLPATLAFIFLLPACNLGRNEPAAVSEAPPVLIQGTIHGSVGTILLQLPDPLAYDQPTILDSIRVDSAGRFSVSFALSAPQHVQMNFGEQYIPLFLMPGDSLSLEYDFEQDEATFTGRGGAVQNYLQALSLTDEQFPLYHNLPMEQYIARMDSLTNARMALLEALRPQALSEHPAHPFLELARVEIEAGRLEDLHQYPMIHQYVTNSTSKPELPPVVLAQIEAYPLSHDPWFEARAYRDLMTARLSRMISDTLKQEKRVYEERHYRYADSLLNGRMREFALAQVVQKSLTYGSGIATGEQFMERFKARHPASSYLPYLQELHARAARVAVGRAAPPFTAVDLQGNVVRLEDLRGKLVYLDIWASWCLPCRKSIPDIIQLTTDMKDQPVQVVMLSVDADPEEWRKLASAHPGPLHLWMEGHFDSSFAKDYNLSGVPKYFLLDRQGVIMDNNGPYPKEAKEKLEALLKES